MRVNIKEFKRLIKEIGTQKEVAEMLGESQQTISNIVNERIKLNKGHMLKLIGLKTVIENKKEKK